MKNWILLYFLIVLTFLTLAILNEGLFIIKPDLTKLEYLVFVISVCFLTKISINFYERFKNGTL